MKPLREITYAADDAQVVMLVGNTCVNDTRVLKEAQSLQQAGYRVTVLCDSDYGRLDHAEQDGVSLRRVDLSLLRSLPAWLQRVMGGLRARRVRAQARATSDAVTAPASVVPPASSRVTEYAPVAAVLKLLRHRAIKRAALRSLSAMRADVVHAHDLETLPAAVALARRWRAQLIYDAHELERHRVGLSALERGVLGWVEARHITRAARVITVCDSIAAHLARVYAIQLPAVVLNSPNLAEQRRAPQALRAVLGLSADVPLAVYIGRLAPQRGVEQVLPVLAQWSELHLVCVGSRDEVFAQGVRREAAQRGVDARLHLLAPVPPFEVVDFIGSADLAVVLIQDACLSYRYALPNKLFEASFAGLPVVASDLPEQRRFVEQAGNGVLVKGADTDAIAHGMRDVYRRRQQLRLDPVRLAALADTYAWPAQSSKLLAVYAELLALRHAP